MAKFNKKRAFTITELLVVIAIITLFSTLSIPIFRVGERMYLLQNSAYRLAQGIRRAQEMAMAAKSKTGFGVYLSSNTDYFIIYEDSTSSNNEIYDDSTDKIVETISLEKGVLIWNISPTSSLSINFRPPDPKVRIGNQFQTSTQAIITLALKSDLTKQKKVFVNQGGLICVDCSP